MRVRPEYYGGSPTLAVIKLRTATSPARSRLNCLLASRQLHVERCLKVDDCDSNRGGLLPWTEINAEAQPVCIYPENLPFENATYTQIPQVSGTEDKGQIRHEGPRSRDGLSANGVFSNHTLSILRISTPSVMDLKSHRTTVLLRSCLVIGRHRPRSLTIASRSKAAFSSGFTTTSPLSVSKPRTTGLPLKELNKRKPTNAAKPVTSALRSRPAARQSDDDEWELKAPTEYKRQTQEEEWAQAKKINVENDAWNDKLREIEQQVDAMHKWDRSDIEQELLHAKLDAKLDPYYRMDDMLQLSDDSATNLTMDIAAYGNGLLERVTSAVTTQLNRYMALYYQITLFPLDTRLDTVISAIEICAAEVKRIDAAHQNFRETVEQELIALLEVNGSLKGESQAHKKLWDAFSVVSNGQIEISKHLGAAGLKRLEYELIRDQNWRPAGQTISVAEAARNRDDVRFLPFFFSCARHDHVARILERMYLLGPEIAAGKVQIGNHSSGREKTTTGLIGHNIREIDFHRSIVEHLPEITFSTRWATSLKATYAWEAQLEGREFKSYLLWLETQYVPKAGFSLVSEDRLLRLIRKLVIVTRRTEDLYAAYDLLIGDGYSSLCPHPYEPFHQWQRRGLRPFEQYSSSWIDVIHCCGELAYKMSEDEHEVSLQHVLSKRTRFQNVLRMIADPSGIVSSRAWASNMFEFMACYSARFLARDPRAADTTLPSETAIVDPEIDVPKAIEEEEPVIEVEVEVEKPVYPFGKVYRYKKSMLRTVVTGKNTIRR